MVNLAVSSWGNWMRLRSSAELSRNPKFKPSSTPAARESAGPARHRLQTWLVGMRAMATPTTSRLSTTMGHWWEAQPSRQVWSLRHSTLMGQTLTPKLRPTLLRTRRAPAVRMLGSCLISCLPLPDTSWKSSGKVTAERTSTCRQRPITGSVSISQRATTSPPRR